MGELDVGTTTHRRVLQSDGKQFREGYSVNYAQPFYVLFRVIPGIAVNRGGVDARMELFFVECPTSSS